MNKITVEAIEVIEVPCNPGGSMPMTYLGSHQVMAPITRAAFSGWLGSQRLFYVATKDPSTGRWRRGDAVLQDERGDFVTAGGDDLMSATVGLRRFS